MTDVLGKSRTFWDAHAERDPLWAVLSEAGKEERKWDVRRFFQTGVNEVALIFYQLDSHGVDVKNGCALDFGCGVGRLTQALAPRFERVVGVLSRSDSVPS
jgi:tRNA/tmRNA/rRNA uracil-C5-methylase (TrmA/RlmC/RlmD family)